MKNSKQIVFLSLMLVFLTLFSSGCDFFKNGSFIPDEEYCDDYVCSCFDPDIYLFKNKLYYDYRSLSIPLPFFKREGIVEIDQNGSRIVSEGLETGFNKLVKFKDELISINSYRLIDEDSKPRADRRILKFNTETYEAELFSTIDADIWVKDFYSFNNTLYLITDDKIYASTDGVKVKLVFDKMKEVNGDCYSLAHNSDNSVSFVYQSKDNRVVEYNLTDKMTVFYKKISKNLLSDSILRDVVRLGDNIYYFKYDELSFEIYNVGDGFRKLADVNIGTVSHCWCGCGNTLYIGDYDEGIISVDLNSGETKRLIKCTINNIYMLGNKWVYYRDSENNLRRISSDGSTDELVYG